MPGFDVFYISAGEVCEEKHWSRVQDVWPHACWIKNSTSIHSAYERARHACRKDRYLLIDADAWVYSDKGLADLYQRGTIVSTSARNTVNHLVYGNGGVKVCDRRVLWQSLIDFCWQEDYTTSDVVSCDTKINCDAQHAWRSGYREGFKTFIRYEKGQHYWKEWSQLDIHTQRRLSVWVSVGSDAEHGIWSMWGAAQGAVNAIDRAKGMMHVDSRTALELLWQRHRAISCTDILEYLYRLHEVLRQYGISAEYLEPRASRWWKKMWINPDRQGNMLV